LDKDIIFPWIDYCR